MRTSSPSGQQGRNNLDTQTKEGTSNHQCSHGKIMVVGLGPGEARQLTPRAARAIEEAQVIVGYKTYLSFIKDLIKGKEIISSGMRKEIDRARIALDRAAGGQIVAVVSSGDPGVYGMAGIVLELAGDRIPVEVIPGVTAATSAAAVLGAPLMHDFAVISLSDLLTPWEAILRRLEAAAASDFVIVLYNPKSQGRHQQIAAARDIFLKHKSPDTPVGIVQNAGRREENKVVSTLGKMLDEEINMQSTVIIGNSQTLVIHGNMITPRGYSL